MNGIYIGDKQILTTLKDGSQFILRSDDLDLTPRILINGEWEPEVSKTFGNLVSVAKKAPVVLDIGCNVGYFTLMAQKLRKDSIVYALDCLPEMVEITKKNLFINNCKANVFSMFLGAEDVVNKTLYVSEFQKGSTGIINRGELGETKKLEVQTTRLDTLFEQLRCDAIDVMKIDIEGSEEEVLLAAPDTMSHTKALVVEFFPSLMKDPGNFLDFLAYYFEDIRATHGIDMSFDNLVAWTKTNPHNYATVTCTKNKSFPQSDEN